MTDYCSTDQIKVVLLIDSDDEDYDTELENILTTQEAVIDNELTNYTTVPLTTIPQMVEDCCIELCRLQYRYRRAPDMDSLNVLRALRKEALKDLRRYIEITYLSEAALVIAEDREEYE